MGWECTSYRDSCPECQEKPSTMVARLDYRWHLRKVMADREMFVSTDLLQPLKERGIALSSSQIYRLVAERPERLNLKTLMALLDILSCTMDDLIEPIAETDTARKPKKLAANQGDSS